VSIAAADGSRTVVSAPRLTRMSPALVVLLLTLLLGLQPVTTDLYLPALPTLQRDLGASVSTSQLTLSVLIICFGLAQLVCGPLADRFGRRPVLLVGLAAYTLASALSAGAASIGWLITWRAAQGAAMAAAVTCGRSIVRDLYEPRDGARVMSRALSGLGVIAMAAPLIGGVLVQLLGWPATLGMTALFGAMSLVFVAVGFRETLARPDPQATQARRLLQNWRSVLAHPTFRAWTALLCCSYGGLFAVLAGSSFVYIQVLGCSRTTYGLFLASNGLAYVCGTWLCRRLLPRFGLRGTVRRGAFLSLAGGLGLSALSLWGPSSVWAVCLPQLLFALGHGIHQPCGQAGAVGPFPDKAGTAASLSGFAMMAVAFGVGGLLAAGQSWQRVATSLPMSACVGACSLVLAGVAWTCVQRHGDPVPLA
jgi:DHA1 family bicyclomycin/chloramphenicol resistance-like MFS transporter